MMMMSTMMSLTRRNFFFFASLWFQVQHLLFGTAKNVSKCWNLDKGGWVVLYIPTHPSLSLYLTYTVPYYSFTRAHTHSCSQRVKGLFLTLSFLYLSFSRREKIKYPAIKGEKRGWECDLWQLCLLASRERWPGPIKSQVGSIKHKSKRVRIRVVSSRKQRAARFAIRTFALFWLW